MSLETEVKVRVDARDMPQVRKRCLQLGGRCIGKRTHESNVLFDFSGETLQAAGCALRLRQAGKKARLTFKGRLRSESPFKQRQEIEVGVDDAPATSRVLEALGLKSCFEYSKFRQMYALRVKGKRVLMSIDETPVGVFVELEGPEDVLEQAAGLFGWSRDVFLSQTYIELYRKAGLG